ncbi:hypothetical protein EON64_06575 [archaeon]|nr:MAG: hypothetical protein EON64_06575 [archaeon]
MPGATAYGGVTDALRPASGETVFIFAASEAMGGLVGMLCKVVFGCKMIGSCVFPRSAHVCSVYHFDHHSDYKAKHSMEKLMRGLRAVAPAGIDLYVENVGGMHIEAAMQTINIKGRVAVCGCISQYNTPYPEKVGLGICKVSYGEIYFQGFVSTDCGLSIR